VRKARAILALGSAIGIAGGLLGGLLGGRGSDDA